MDDPDSEPEPDDLDEPDDLAADQLANVVAGRVRSDPIGDGRSITHPVSITYPVNTGYSITYAPTPSATHTYGWYTISNASTSTDIYARTITSSDSITSSD